MYLGILCIVTQTIPLCIVSGCKRENIPTAKLEYGDRSLE